MNYVRAAGATLCLQLSFVLGLVVLDLSWPVPTTLKCPCPFRASSERKGKQRDILIDRPVSVSSVMNGSCDQTAVFARGAWQRQVDRPSILGFATSTSHRLLATALTLVHGYQVPTTEGAGQRSLLTERGHRGHESRKGNIQYHTS